MRLLLPERRHQIKQAQPQAIYKVHISITAVTNVLSTSPSTFCNFPVTIIKQYVSNLAGPSGRGLRRRSTAARLLRSWVRIPPGAWMFVCCVCCVLSGGGLFDELITHPDGLFAILRMY
jgi:hypothetical protein